MRVLLRCAAVALGTFGLTFWTVHDPVGEPKAGRILVDDLHSGHWEPTARRLSPDWFGDFSTYSFTSAAELLGYTFAVDVNEVHDYSDELLADYDVLVLKTPIVPFASSEIEAIRRFVHRGGGLFLIGDHTDLQDSSTILNDFANWADMEFRFDAVSDAYTGGFSMFDRSGEHLHPATRGTPRMLYLTGCSLAIGPTVRVIQSVPHQVGVPGDYADNSRFGRSFADPAAKSGEMVLAAESSYGRGRVVAFTDSTILSSFGIRKYDRDVLVVRILGFLNTTAGSRGALCWLGTALALIALFAGLRRTGPRPPGLLAAMLASAASGYWFAEQVEIRLEDRAYPVVQAVESPPTLAIEWSNGIAEYMPVLGTPDDAVPSRGFETMFAAVQRSGVFPILTDDVDFLFSHDAVMLLNPAEPYSAEFGERLRSYLDAGGRVVIAVDTTVLRPAALASLADPLGIEFALGDPREPQLVLRGATPVPAPGGFVLATKQVGAGKLVVALHAENWSRERMGHCFSRPSRKQLSAYECLHEILSTHLGVAPQVRRSYRILD